MSIDAISNNILTKTDANIGISKSGKIRNVVETSERGPTPKEKAEIIYPEDKAMSQEDAIKTIEKANKEFITYDRRFEFSIHEKTKQIMVKVIDANNDEVIRELPPEKILDMVAAMWEVAGILIDRKI